MKTETEKTLVGCIIKERIAGIISDLQFLIANKERADKYYQALFAVEALDAIIDDIRFSL